MPLARIISRSPERTTRLAEFLTERGYQVETVGPDHLFISPSDLEFDVDKMSPEAALARAAQAITESEERARVAPQAAPPPRMTLSPELSQPSASAPERRATGMPEEEEPIFTFGGTIVPDEEGEDGSESERSSWWDKTAAPFFVRLGHDFDAWQQRRMEQREHRQSAREQHQRGRVEQQAVLARQREEEANARAEQQAQLARDRAAAQAQAAAQAAARAAERQAVLARQRADEEARQQAEAERRRAEETELNEQRRFAAAERQRQEEAAAAQRAAAVQQIEQPLRSQEEDEERRQRAAARMRPLAPYVAPVSSRKAGRRTPPSAVEQTSPYVPSSSGRLEEWSRAFTLAAAFAVAVMIGWAFATAGSRGSGSNIRGDVNQQVPFGAVTVKPSAAPAAVPPRHAAPTAQNQPTQPAPKPSPRVAKPAARSPQASHRTPRQDDVADDVVVRHFQKPPAAKPSAMQISKAGPKRISDE